MQFVGRDVEGKRMEVMEIKGVLLGWVITDLQ